MSQRERGLIAGILALVAALVGVDLVNDYGEGVMTWHLLIEAITGCAALLGVFYILRDSMTLKNNLATNISEFSKFKKEAEVWQAESRKYVEGLSVAIDQQLTKWNLTNAEREVAFLLLKGLSLKEVADVRGTSEKTARGQSLSIYAKAGLSGRSELSAFFLEDLLMPSP